MFTNDQQLFKVATHITWYKQDKWKYIFPILGGVHTLMCFVGCFESLWANTGLSDLLNRYLKVLRKYSQAKIFHRIQELLCAYV